LNKYVPDLPGGAEDIAAHPRTAEEIIESELIDSINKLAEVMDKNEKSAKDLTEEYKKGTEFEVVPPGM